MSSSGELSPPDRRQSSGGGPQSSGPSGKKKRVRNWTEDDRAVHRVFERSRREAFKERLQASLTLASLVPSLRGLEPNRLSKHVVINESIALLQTKQQKATGSPETVDALLAEREELLAELNTWRASAGLDARQARVLPTSIDVSESSGALALAIPEDRANDANRVPQGSDEQTLMEEDPVPFGAGDIESAFGLMTLPVQPDVSTMGIGPIDPSWNQSTAEFPEPDIEPNFHDLLPSQAMSQPPITDTYELPLPDLVQPDPYDNNADIGMVSSLGFTGATHLYIA
ncbi:hypothetical protein TOPH_08615 [Tolypocladium ophioglossoides CBS 100239]|uniref:BHLH domain-containing protein n=1 Tax=Tolypocladium ophioglossoides (strain CBS 100239) TaxID=1163406 RepID=A0A0L0MXY4_TOLOC|nr:hypothetical protein TOPH_08615 [Tolypocladium ophioglossoides CBS 100239]